MGEASGSGTVHTYTVIRQNWRQPFRRPRPYVVAMVELDEGPRMMSNITDCDPDDVRIGLPVDVLRREGDDDLGLPFWRPVE